MNDTILHNTKHQIALVYYLHYSDKCIGQPFFTLSFPQVLIADKVEVQALVATRPVNKNMKRKT